MRKFIKLILLHWTNFILLLVALLFVFIESGYADDFCILLLFLCSFLEHIKEHHREDLPNILR
ncbi:hypothetical protein FACS1894153_4620 [Bacteroidia bacterium]|nr:hypothetical protein FACS1894153_4620 [Bacteroidia bacterium]